PITYKEADLKITNLTVPSGVRSGQTIPVTYTVTNIGNRDTRVDGWMDRIFLSHDASLADMDTESTPGVGHGRALKPGRSEPVNTQVPLPDSIDGDFHLIVYPDAAARETQASVSDVGFHRYGITFDQAPPLAPWDLVSFATRNLARGDVA